MAKVKLFNNKAIERIRTDVKWGEEVRRQQKGVHHLPFKDVGPVIYARLTEKDFTEAGYWKATEVVVENGKWENLDNGIQFNDDEYPPIRHKDWEDSRVGAIIKAYTMPDATSEDKPSIWVFEEEITNPETFTFYATETGGSAQSTKTTTWKMPKGGTVYTNYGEMDVPDDFEIDAGESAWCKIEFVWMFDQWQIASAAMTDEEGDYWDEQSGVLIVHVKIFSTEINGEICRGVQHHAGDIRFELNKDTTVTAGNEWIIVTNNNRNYTVYHTLPDPPKPLNDFLAFMGNCNDMPLDSFASWAEWVRRNLVHIKYDKLGHIYEREECYDGTVERVVPIEDPEVFDLIDDPVNLEATLTAPLFGSVLQPWAMTGGDGFVPTYTILAGGNLFTDYVGVESIMFIARNSQQQLIQIATDPAAAVPAFDINKVELAKNVNGTSGQAYDQMVLSQRDFRFNDTIEVRAGVAGKGLGKSVTLNTASLSAVVSHTPSAIIRQREDPNATNDYSLFVSYAPPNAGTLNTANYKVEIVMTWASDGDPVLFSTDNGQNTVQNGTVIGDITANDDYTMNYILMDATDRASGDAIRVNTRLIFIDAIDGYVTDANAPANMSLYYSNDTECVYDESGEDATDESGECATAEEALFLDMTAEFGDNFGGTAGNCKDEYLFTAVNFTNTLGYTCKVVADSSFGVDDDLVIDGVIFEEGLYGVNGCTPDPKNGAHSYADGYVIVETVAPNQTLSINVLNHHGNYSGAGGKLKMLRK